MSRKLVFRLVLAFVLVVVIIRLFNTRPKYTLNHVNGQTMGTVTYNVKYLSEDPYSLQHEIDSILRVFNQSLSTYISDSEISRFNRNDSITFSLPFFYPVLKGSAEVYEATDGAFDPTIGPLVNVWGFGPDKTVPLPDSALIDSLIRYVGFDRIAFDEKGATKPAGMYLDLSAIAKGYAVDVLVEFLKEKGLENYMVEIGGEVRCGGINQEGKVWTIGIENPVVQLEERELLAIVRLKDRALATSGNYRNYYERDGRLYAHIIDPRTGYAATHQLLSASVFADNCMTADAFATALMVLGTERSREIIQASGIDAILIYRDNDGEIRSYVSPGIRPFVEMNKAEQPSKPY